MYQMTGNDPLSALVTDVAAEESIAYTFSPLPPIMPPNPMMARRWNNMAKKQHEHGDMLVFIGLLTHEFDLLRPYLPGNQP